MTFSLALARKSAKIVAQAIMQAMRDGKPLPPTPGGEKLYAAQLGSAAVMEALATGKDIGKLQANLITQLNKLHDANPSWGPLFVSQPGQLRRDYFIPQALRRLRRAM